jgi:hypothetical protein
MSRVSQRKDTARTMVWFIVLVFVLIITVMVVAPMAFASLAEAQGQAALNKANAKLISAAAGAVRLQTFQLTTLIVLGIMTVLVLTAVVGIGASVALQNRNRPVLTEDQIARMVQESMREMTKSQKMITAQEEKVPVFEDEYRSVS